MTNDRMSSNRYMGFIALILGFVVVYWLKAVLLPLVIALFMIALAWPIAHWLDQMFPRRISYMVSYVVLSTLLGIFGYVVYLSVAQLTSQIPEYEEQFITLLNDIRHFFRMYGLPTPGELHVEQLQEMTAFTIDIFYSTLGHVVLIVALVILGLPELVFWEEKLKHCLGSNGNSWRKAGAEAAQSFQKYLTVMAGIGLLTGIVTFAFCWIVGLDFALLWGVLAFVMNFIPFLGALLAIIPPILVATMQFSDPSMILWIVVGLGFIQFFMGNVVDPMLQSRFLSMSPIVLVLSIAFWGFLWGAPGAFLAVPLTHIFMITCSKFSNTSHIACLMSEGNGLCK